MALTKNNTGMLPSSGGSSLTTEQSSTLDYLTYDQEAGRLVASKPLETTLNSLYLGEQHKISSGAENIFFSNTTSDIDWYPAWGGLKNQADQDNQDADGVIAPSARVYGDFFSLPLGGAPLAGSSIGYIGENPFTVNIAGLGITTEVAENIASDTRLEYLLSVEGVEVYQQILTHEGLTAGETLTWFFDHPVEIHAGTTIHAAIYLIDSEDTRLSVLQVRVGDDGTGRYQATVHNRLFEDADLAFKSDLVGVGEDGVDLTGVAVNFRLDDTSTSIVMDNGTAFGVNTIKAVADADGTVHIHAIGAGNPLDGNTPNTLKHFVKLEVGNALVNGAVISGGLNDIVNTLNELFTVGAFESVVIADPFSTMVADVSGVDAVGSLAGNALNPSTLDIAAGQQAHYNKAGWLSTDTIDQAGEYFTFDIRMEGIIGMGLVCDDISDVNGNATYGDPSKFCDGVTNSGNYGFQFAHFFHPSPNGPWTNYGANTGYVMQSGWSNATHKFSGSPEGQDWLDDNPVKMRVGIDNNGFISIDYFDASESVWIAIARTSYPTVAGVEYKLGIKLCDSVARLYSLPKVHLLEPAAPVMNFRYIESPDGNYDYPIFVTAEEAEYYDLQNGGTGTSSTATYADDPTYTTWYIPTNGFNDDQSAVPTGGTFMGTNINWTEITSLTNADLTPTQFSMSDITQEEGTNVNIQVVPAGATWTSSVSISPNTSGLVYDGYSLIQGTLADVGADTTYTVTVTRANSYGSSTGSMTITATDVAPTQTNDTPWTKALVFDGTSEYLNQASTSSSYNALRMGYKTGAVPASSASAGETSGHSDARPWATAVVFNPDGDYSDEYIWNQGMGSGSMADNVYLRLDNVQTLWFGWGRGNNTNECRLLTNVSTSNWHGIYVGFRGTRLSSSDASAANLADCFDIRWAYQTSTDVVLSSTQLSTSANWIDTGNSMTENMDGKFTVGGRAANRSFHGKVASMVVTTLKQSVAMPSTSEIELMIKDPIKWVTDHKVGNTYRSCGGSGTNPNFQIGSTAYRDTKVWLMGDGTNDSYANGMRNYIYTGDNAATKLTMMMMNSNDIQTVNINGLT